MFSAKSRKSHTKRNIGELMYMTKSKEICKESGVPKETCSCEKCEPIVVDIRTSLLEVRNVNELSEKISNILALVNYLKEGGFEIEISTDANEIQVHPPRVGGCYWAQCKGCGYPFIVDYGLESGLFCETCARTAQSKRDGHPRYYDDLFNYIDFSLRNKRIPTGYDGELPLTQEFCEFHSFDFSVIKSRLNATGGYDPGEVLMNSMWSIPWFDKLPPIAKGDDG
jgi:hypothetical protein